MVWLFTTVFLVVYKLSAKQIYSNHSSVWSTYCILLYCTLRSFPVSGSFNFASYLPCTIFWQIFRKRDSRGTTNNGVSKNGWFSLKSSSLWFRRISACCRFACNNLMSRSWGRARDEVTLEAAPMSPFSIRCS